MEDSAIDGAVINREATFLHQFFDVPVTEGVREIPTNPLQDNVPENVGLDISAMMASLKIASG